MESKPLSAPLFLLTPRALEQVRQVLAQQEAPGHWLEVEARPTACKEMEYALGLVHTPAKEQVSWHQEGQGLCTSLSSLRYLAGATLDFVQTEAEAGFKFSNTRECEQCGCGALGVSE